MVLGFVCLFFKFKILENCLHYSVHLGISGVTFQEVHSYLTVTRGNGFISSFEFVKITYILKPSLNNGYSVVVRNLADN